MKIDTKKTTSISPSIMINENKNIPSIRTDDDSCASPCGRTINYEPTVIFTPVMTCERTKRSSCTRPRLTKDQVDDVCVLLNDLFIKEDEETKEDEVDCTAAATKEKSVQWDDTPATPTSPLRRSARLAAKQ